MVLSAIILFALAAAFGLVLVIMGARNRCGSLILGLGHAGLAVTALGLLMTQIFLGQTHMLYNDAALLFILALTGGLVLLALRKDRKPPPMLVVGIHGTMATLALLILMVGYF